MSYRQKKITQLHETLRNLQRTALQLNRGIHYAHFKYALVLALSNYLAERRLTVRCQGGLILPDDDLRELTDELEAALLHQFEHTTSCTPTTTPQAGIHSSPQDCLLGGAQQRAAAAAGQFCGGSSNASIRSSSCNTTAAAGSDTSHATGQAHNTRGTSSMLPHSSLNPGGLFARARSVHCPLAPVSDPMAVLRHLHNLPLMPAADTMPLQEALELQNRTVGQLAVALQMHESGMGDQLSRIQQLLEKVLHLVCSLIVRRRPTLVMAMVLTNIETGEVLTGPDKERLAAVLGKLQLSPGQCARISLGKRVFEELLNPVGAELRRLQAQPHAATDCTSPSSSSDAGDGSSGPAGAAPHSSGTNSGAGGSSSSEATAAAAQPDQQQQQVDGDSDAPQVLHHGAVLQQQRRRERRLNVLLHKDIFLRSAMGSYLFGCLSWLQLAKLFVLMSPYTPATGMVALLVAQQYEQQQEQQLQQQLEEQQRQQQLQAVHLAARGGGGVRKPTAVGHARPVPAQQQRQRQQ